MILSQLIQFLESIAPLRFQESYDNAGLIVGNPEVAIRGILVSLDATKEVVQDAIERGCNVVVSHHPIVFRGIKQFSADSYVHRAVIHAIKNDIALYAIHTNLDNVLQNGVNQKIAQKIGLTGVGLLSPKTNLSSDTSHLVGAGVIGEWEEPKSAKKVLSWLKECMQLAVIRHTAMLDRPIQYVAICGGAGSFLLSAAKERKADLFVTADFKYHEFFDADGQLMIADIGHYESEYFTIELLRDLISEKFPKFAAHFTSVNTNPVRYF